ncbi:hypothetical protein MSAN_00823700 [Mycena sanguinolenta]|uniref:Uncharacterized protein n=1 Tax=Mycena sanguinolenta TaxID=230812 RepID=A0A8H6YYH6_9AGAR|nr:hypothetical protein MSAN_00823700 [Mycena sanguinolenta]
MPPNLAAKHVTCLKNITSFNYLKISSHLPSVWNTNQALKFSPSLLKLMVYTALCTRQKAATSKALIYEHVLHILASSCCLLLSPYPSPLCLRARLSLLSPRLSARYVLPVFTSVECDVPVFNPTSCSASHPMLAAFAQTEFALATNMVCISIDYSTYHV